MSDEAPEPSTRAVRAILWGLVVILFVGIALAAGPKEAAVPLFCGLAGGAAVVMLIMLIMLVRHFRR